jgi:hypothetical protein
LVTARPHCVLAASARVVTAITNRSLACAPCSVSRRAVASLLWAAVRTILVSFVLTPPGIILGGLNKVLNRRLCLSRQSGKQQGRNCRDDETFHDWLHSSVCNQTFCSSNITFAFQQICLKSRTAGKIVLLWSDGKSIRDDRQKRLAEVEVPEMLSLPRHLYAKPFPAGEQFCTLRRRAQFYPFVQLRE